MTEVICAGIGACSAIVCALVASQNRRRDRADAERLERSERRAAMRMRESHLQMRMLAAVSDLTIGLAMAFKRGHANGEIESGLIAVKAAQKDYEDFLEEIAAQHLTK